MKTFNDFDSCFNWIEGIIKKTNETAKEDIAREVYEDSKKYTYIDTQAMYDSGQSSDFKRGFVVIKAPQVRWLYYTTGIRPHKNKKAVPMWFEATKRTNGKKYKRMYNESFLNNLK